MGLIVNLIGLDALNATKVVKIISVHTGFAPRLIWIALPIAISLLLYQKN